MSAVVFGASWVVATRRPVPGIELDATRFLSDAPDAVAHALWPVMQLGTLWAPLVAALVVGLVQRNWLLAACLVVADVLTWTSVRGLKQIVDRGRPAAYLADVVVRDDWARGLGFPSGHSAMAATTAVVCMAAVPRRHRWVLVLLAALVGLGRVVHGVHLPGDVLGGWAFGTLVGVATLAVYDRCSTGRPVSSSAPSTS